MNLFSVFQKKHRHIDTSESGLYNASDICQNMAMAQAVIGGCSLLKAKRYYGETKSIAKENDKIELKKMIRGILSPLVYPWHDKINKSILFETAVQNNYKNEVVRLIRKGGVYANTPIKGSSHHFNRLPALSAMIDIGCFSMAKLLLKFGANPNECDEWGMTALHHACLCPAGLNTAKQTLHLSPRHQMILRDLIAHLIISKADLTAVDYLGRTPFMCLKQNPSVQNKFFEKMFLEQKPVKISTQKITGIQQNQKERE